MILSKIKFAANEIHFLIIPPLLIAFGFKYPILFLLLIIYLIYIYKKRIMVKPIIIITVMFSAIFTTYKLYTPKYSQSFKGIIVEADENKYIISNGLYGALFYSNDDFEVGDVITIKGKYESPKRESYEGGFSYREYLKSKRVYKIYKYPETKKRGYILLPISCRYKLKSYLSKRVNNDSLSYISTLFLGDNMLDSGIKDKMSNIGISHLFAISGFHIMLIYSFLVFILKRLIKSERAYTNIIMAFLIFYVLFTGFLISILRSVIMIIISILSKRYNRLYTSLDGFSISMLLALIINPGYVYQTSFLLTYLITFFLIISSGVINDKNKLKGAYKIGIVAYLSSLPIIININNDINLISILLVPIFSILVGYILMPYLVFVLLINRLEKMNIIKMFEFIVIKCQKIHFLTFRFKHLNIYFIIVYYILFITILILIEKKRSIKKMSLAFLSYMIFLYSIRITCQYNIVTFIDVCQGDSCLIELAHNKGNILIDTYGYNASYLKHLGINKLDYLIITHSDDDHSKNVTEIIKEFKVGNVLINKYDSIISGEKYLLSGDKIYVGDIVINVLSPTINMNDKNNNSLVLSTNISGYKLLLTGDIEAEGERYLVDNMSNSLNADILKVGHHGSSTSSTKEFIEAVSPKYSIISCGLGNKYGFPHESVINVLSKSNIYRTDRDGNIKFIFKNKLTIRKRI